MARKITKRSIVLQMMDGSNGASATEIMDRLNITRSTAQSYVSELREQGHEIAMIDVGKGARYYLVSSLEVRETVSSKILTIIKTGDEWSAEEIASMVDKDVSTVRALLRYVSHKNGLNLVKIKSGKTIYYRVE